MKHPKSVSIYFHNNSIKVPKYFQKLPKVEESKGSIHPGSKNKYLKRNLFCISLLFLLIFSTSLVNDATDESMRKELLLNIIIFFFLFLSFSLENSEMWWFKISNGEHLPSFTSFLPMMAKKKLLKVNCIMLIFNFLIQFPKKIGLG